MAQAGHGAAVAPSGAGQMVAVVDVATGTTLAAGGGGADAQPAIVKRVVASTTRPKPRAKFKLGEMARAKICVG